MLQCGTGQSTFLYHHQYLRHNHCGHIDTGTSSIGIGKDLLRDPAQASWSVQMPEQRMGICHILRQSRLPFYLYSMKALQAEFSQCICYRIFIF